MHPAVLRRRAFLLAAPLVLGACTDRVTGPPPFEPPGAPAGALQCTVSVRAGTMACASPSETQPSFAVAPSGRARGNLIVGGQGVNVRLTSSNVNYDAATGRFRADVTLTNLMDGVMGSHDGVQHAGMLVFFHSEPSPTAGNGSVELANPDGLGVFTGSGQQYFVYDSMLARGQTSDPRTWEFRVDPSVETFAFQVYVEAPLFTTSAQEVEGVFQQVSAGGSFACGLDVEGKAYCWGQGRWGLLGTGVTWSFLDPAPVAGNHVFRSISSRTHTCAVTPANQAWCWGDNWFGQVGAEPNVIQSGFYPNDRFNTVPAAVTGGISFSQVETGDSFTCGLDLEGRAYCWGWGDYGQLGNGTKVYRQQSPVAVSGDHRFTTVRAGGRSACALKDDGTAWCWGDNYHGQLGAVTSAETCGGEGSFVPCSTTPVRVDTEVRFDSIDVGMYFACGLSAGQAFCWGYNDRYQLGTRSVQETTRPVAVETGARFARIVTGAEDALGIRADGTAVWWGTANRQTYGEPIEAPGGLRWKSLSSVSMYRCGATLEGRAYCWGRENTGQFGNLGHHEESSLVPTPVAPLHLRDLPPKAGFWLAVSGREASTLIYEVQFNWQSDPTASRDDYAIVQYLWSFGDGTTAEGRNARHSYAAPGTYAVTLTVVDAKGQRGAMTQYATIY